jgi:hypothetical protein
MLGSGSHTPFAVFWCRNLGCDHAHSAFGFPFIQTLTDETILKCTSSNGLVVRGIARDVDEERTVEGSKIGGLPFGCAAEVPEYDEFLASIEASQLGKPDFPAHAALGLFVNKGEIGYCMML